MAAAAACGAQLAAWGATVVKVEPPWGERGRDSGAASKTLANGRRVNPRFELHNRGKRSLAVDLTDARGRALLDRLLARADAALAGERHLAPRAGGASPGPGRAGTLRSLCSRGLSALLACRQSPGAGRRR